MHELSILITFTGGLAVALVFGYLAHRLKLSPIIGYLLAGVVVGPFTPGFVADRAIAEQFAEIGVILLLFGIGLRFNLRELIAVWRLAVPGALIQSTISTAVLAMILHLMGWNWVSGIILGMAISVASTVVMALVLAEWHDLHARIGHIAIGWTVVEDILTVAMLLLLPIIFAPDRSEIKASRSVLGLAGTQGCGSGCRRGRAGQVGHSLGAGTYSQNPLTGAFHAGGAGSRHRDRGRLRQNFRGFDGARGVSCRTGRRPF